MASKLSRQIRGWFWRSGASWWHVSMVIWVGFNVLIAPLVIVPAVWDAAVAAEGGEASGLPTDILLGWISVFFAVFAVLSIGERVRALPR